MPLVCLNAAITFRISRHRVKMLFHQKAVSLLLVGDTNPGNLLHRIGLVGTALILSRVIKPDIVSVSNTFHRQVMVTLFSPHQSQSYFHCRYNLLPCLHLSGVLNFQNNVLLAQKFRTSLLFGSFFSGD